MKMLAVTSKKISEAPIGIWAWGFLLVFIIVYVAVMDTWLHRHGYEYMTTEFREALATTWGGMLMALWIGTFVGLTWHFVRSKP